MNHSRPNITDTLKKCYPFWEKLTDTQKEQLKTSSYIRIMNQEALSTAVLRNAWAF